MIDSLSLSLKTKQIASSFQISNCGISKKKLPYKDKENEKSLKQLQNKNYFRVFIIKILKFISRGRKKK